MDKLWITQNEKPIKNIKRCGKKVLWKKAIFTYLQQISIYVFTIFTIKPANLRSEPEL